MACALLTGFLTFCTVRVPKFSQLGFNIQYYVERFAIQNSFSGFRHTRLKVWFQDFSPSFPAYIIFLDIDFAIQYPVRSKRSKIRDYGFLQGVAFRERSFRVLGLIYGLLREFAVYFLGSNLRFFQSTV